MGGTIELSKVEEVLREVIQARGYVVIGMRPGFSYEIGEVIRQIFQFDTEQPYRVMCETDGADYVAQSDLISSLRPKWRRSPQPACETFYRITTD